MRTSVAPSLDGREDLLAAHQSPLLRPSTPFGLLNASESVDSPPSGNTRSRTRGAYDTVHPDELGMEPFELDMQADPSCGLPLTTRKASDETGRNTPKDLLFKSPPRRLFASVTEARSSRLRARAACVPLSDLGGVGLPGNILGDVPLTLGLLRGAAHPFQSFAPSYAHTDFRPIPRFAQALSASAPSAEASSSIDNLSSVETLSSWSFPASNFGPCGEGARALETPPSMPNAFETIASVVDCRAPKRARALRQSEPRPPGSRLLALAELAAISKPAPADEAGRPAADASTWM